jgi:transposase
VRHAPPAPSPIPPQLQDSAPNRHYFGLDLGSRELVAAFAGRKPQSFPFTPRGVKNLWVWVRQHHPAGLLHAVAESTGPYGLRFATLWLAQPTTALSLLNPAQVVAFGKSQLKRGKTDALDASSLLLFGQLQHPRPWTPPPPVEVELQALLQEQAALSVELQRVENRSENARIAGRRPRAVARAQANLKRTLRASLARLDQEIWDLITRTPELKRDAALLLSVPGLGPKTTAMLLAKRSVLLGRNTGQLASHAGLAPMPYTSGTSVRRPAHIDPRSDHPFRQGLYLAALSASRFNPDLAAVYRRLRAKGKPTKLALIAVARKLLLIARAILITQCPFQSQLAPIP